MSRVDSSILHKFLGKSFKGCWDLCVLFSKEFGIDLPDINSDKDDYFGEIYKERKDVWERIVSPQMMDIIILHKDNGISCHAGVMISNDRFIHLYKSLLTGKGNVCVTRLSQIKPEKIAGFYRYKNDKVKAN